MVMDRDRVGSRNAVTGIWSGQGVFLSPALSSRNEGIPTLRQRPDDRS
jgi:hypothetical protein